MLQRLHGIGGKKFMSRIKTAFQNGKAFIGFLTGGDPTLDKCEEYILEMVRAGADLIEIGVPFSDPIAEGPVIQQANIRALSSGTTVPKLFELVKHVRVKTDIPLVFLTYLNPVLHYGYDAFFQKCRQSGLDGLIIPDLPFEEQTEVKETARKYGIDIISLIAPTSDQRIQNIAQAADGFIYVVSSMGVTGIRSEITTDIPSIVQKIKAVTDTPTAVGFGINTPEQAQEISKSADGVIVGSAIVKIIAEHGENANESVYRYVHQMKQAIS